MMDEEEVFAFPFRSQPPKHISCSHIFREVSDNPKKEKVRRKIRKSELNCSQSKHVTISPFPALALMFNAAEWRAASEILNETFC